MQVDPALVLLVATFFFFFYWPDRVQVPFAQSSKISALMWFISLC